MITLNDGTVLRNLEEQVLENKEQIAKHWNVDRVLADFGINVLGRLDNTDALDQVPTDNLNYGDAYLIGIAEPYDVWIWTRADVNAGQPVPYWLDIGHIAIEGPQGPVGPVGPKGDTGERGSKWSVGTSLPAITSNVLEGDIWMSVLGDIFVVQKDSNGTLSWVRKGSIRGPQGIQGEQGPVGPVGPVGPQGEQGPQGDVGGFINIWGILTQSSQLPTPASLNNLTVAYLVGTEAPYNLWVQIGENSSTAIWQDTGPFNAATAVSVGGVYQNVWDADTKVDKSSRPNLVYGNNSSGEVHEILWSVEPTAYSIARRGDTGTVKTTYPVADNDAASKAYIDGGFVAKVTEGGLLKVYGVAGNGDQVTYNLISGASNVADGRIPRYRSNTANETMSDYSIVLPTGTPLLDHHAANKQYVDNLLVQAIFNIEADSNNFYHIVLYMKKADYDAITNVDELKTFLTNKGATSLPKAMAVHMGTKENTVTGQLSEQITGIFVQTSSVYATGYSRSTGASTYNQITATEFITKNFISL